MKPVELVERAIQNSSAKGGLVLESFLGMDRSAFVRATIPCGEPAGT